VTACGGCRWPRLSPDCSAIVFVSDFQGTHDLYVIRANGGAVVRVTAVGRVGKLASLHFQEANTLAEPAAAGAGFGTSLIATYTSSARSMHDGYEELFQATVPSPHTGVSERSPAPTHQPCECLAFDRVPPVYGVASAVFERVWGNSAITRRQTAAGASIRYPARPPRTLHCTQGCVAPLPRHVFGG
jgi:hypothetical protein